MIRYTELTKTEDGNLLITLTDEGREKIQDAESVLELLEWHLCNGWSHLFPENIGALTDCDLIISDDAEQNDDGDMTHVGRFYWHEAYQVEDPLETLRNTGTFTLTGTD
jgi:hypothetical protein